MKYLLIFTLFIFVNGCASKKPSESVDFCKMKEASELNGEYSNKSTDLLGGSVIYFSQIVWPEFDEFTLEEHKQIDTLLISTTTNHKVKVEAFSAGTLIKTAQPEHLQTVENGIVSLHGNNSILPHLGTIVGVNSVELFLFKDCSNNIVLGKNTSQTGLGYMVIPITLSNSYYVTFLRVLSS
ncbi:hypothetical protein [Thalassotalea aquiviva]|uniref:hypothetical protein n=1 Tax=Thalassotalea aquiviva TaxID=3242415 RepID=UPI00352A99FF